MKFLLQILFFLFTWFTSQVNATPVFEKVVVPNYEFTFSKVENIKEKSTVKIGVDNFTPVQKELIAKQKKVWKELGIVENIANSLDDALSKILKNDDFKKVYDDLIKGVTPRRFAAELSIQEEAIYKFYTNESYYKYSNALYNGNNLTEDIIELEKLLNRTIGKLSSSPGNYLRAIGKSELDFYKELSINQEFTVPNHLSCTFDRDIAEVFYQKNLTKTGEAAIIDVYSKTGKKIFKFSDASFEAEVLHISKVKFKLKKMELTDEIINLDDYLGGALPIKEKRWNIIIEEI